MLEELSRMYSVMNFEENPSFKILEEYSKGTISKSRRYKGKRFNQIRHVRFRDQICLQIKLNNGSFICDEKYKDLVQKHVWTSYKSGNTRYVKSGGKSFHRHIYPNWKGDIDHFDGNGLNNTLCNLRRVSHKENLKNRRIEYYSGTGWMAFYYDQEGKKYTKQFSCVTPDLEKYEEALKFKRQKYGI
ncbi:5823_t:CDS:1 [Cetraspora pellucida]|uniref:5823_t:CDS:1 n=1 Tax=Cetraspora pellucida TaxID=1433469 RepID=A0ACA9LNE4_9GLOM|nr:5823_t:CDS:1 [Cetraspora pellucida]